MIAPRLSWKWRKRWSTGKCSNTDSLLNLYSALNSLPHDSYTTDSSRLIFYIAGLLRKPWFKYWWNDRKRDHLQKTHQTSFSSIADWISIQMPDVESRYIGHYCGKINKLKMNYAGCLEDRQSLLPRPGMNAPRGLETALTYLSPAGFPGSARTRHQSWPTRSRSCNHRGSDLQLRQNLNGINSERADWYHDKGMPHIIHYMKNKNYNKKTWN